MRGSPGWHRAAGAFVGLLGKARAQSLHRQNSHAGLMRAGQQPLADFPRADATLGAVVALVDDHDGSA